MRRNSNAIFLLLGSVMVASLFIVSSAQAQCVKDVVPPGNSEVDQYRESIPGACGNEGGSKNGPGGRNGSGSPSDSGGGSGGLDRGGSAVAPSTVQKLQALGEDGEAIAELAISTGPSGAQGGRAGSSDPEGRGDPDGASPGSASEDAPTAGGSAVGALAEAFGGSDDGSGVLLPILLAAVFLTLLALAIRRARGGRHGD